MQRRDTRDQRRGGERAVVARRADPGEDTDTTEIRGLAETAGFAVVGSVTQTRPEDPGTYLGDGKVDELAARVEESDADAVVVDGDLTPAQTIALEYRLPDGEVLDRYRLVLAIFADRAGTERARMQVERARLRYELPRLKERTGDHVLSRVTEKGTPVQDAEKRITELERKLDALPSPADRHRKRRRDQGFDLVALAGYTNAGKSTLLHRLADDLSVANADPDHPDETATAAVEDRLFETLSTTTRGAEVAGRRTLVTDTVGFVRDLPHDLVASFSTTLDEAAAADAVVVVADASNPPDRLRERLETTREVLEEADVDPGSVVVALNKADLLSGDELDTRREAIENLAPAPIAISATGGEGVEELRARVADRLPTEYEEVVVPAGDRAMELVSWAYDHCRVIDVEYGDRVRIEVAGRPGVVERLRSRAADTDA